MVSGKKSNSPDDKDGKDVGVNSPIYMSSMTDLNILSHNNNPTTVFPSDRDPQPTYTPLEQESKLEMYEELVNSDKSIHSKDLTNPIYEADNVYHVPEEH